MDDTNLSREKAKSSTNVPSSTKIKPIDIKRVKIKTWRNTFFLPLQSKKFNKVNKNEREKYIKIAQQQGLEN